MIKLQTVCIVQKKEKVLLGLKKRGFGQGKWNGFGGKVQGNETIEEAALREMKEEAGIEIKKMKKIGVLNFNSVKDSDTLEVHIFKVKEFVGNITESEEMKPKWFNIKNIPFDSMWPDDKHWFPLFLEEKKFKGRFLFDETNNIVEYKLEELNENE